jgi:hypothetical protein
MNLFAGMNRLIEKRPFKIFMKNNSYIFACKEIRASSKIIHSKAAFAMALLDREKNDLVDFLSTRVRPNPSVLDAFELLVERNEDVLYNQVRLKARHPHLFTESQAGGKSRLRNEELFEIVLEELGATHAPTQKQIHETLAARGHNVTQWQSKQFHSDLIKNRPDLYQRKTIKHEAKLLALKVQDAMQIQQDRNPGIKDIKVILQDMGTPTHSLMAQFVLVELYALAPHLFISKPKFLYDRRSNRAYIREDLSDDEFVILEEFKKMVGLPAGKATTLMLKTILYLAIVRQVDIANAIAEAKMMTPEICKAYTSIFSKLDLSKV